MLIAGEASGDHLAAELVRAIRAEALQSPAPGTSDSQPRRGSLEPRFFGAGGPRMAEAGVELSFDMTAHAVIGISAVIANLRKFRQLLHQLLHLAIVRQPDVILCVDFSGFNRRFGHAIRRYTRSRQDWFHTWDPKLIQFVSPQVWASRPGRANLMARDFDLLLTLFPFEKDWYADRVPGFPVEFVGHPLVERHQAESQPPAPGGSATPDPDAPRLLLLPGSRSGEIVRHLPVMLETLTLIRATFPRATARMVLPGEDRLAQVQATGLPPGVQAQVGGLADALKETDLAITKTGTATLECALFGVPAVALYKTSWMTYQVGRRIVRVKYAAMPNLLADALLLPEFIQRAATPRNLADAALELLNNPARCSQIRRRLAQVIASLGGPGAATRAARAILSLMEAPR